MKQRAMYYVIYFFASQVRMGHTGRSTTYIASPFIVSTQHVFGARKGMLYLRRLAGQSVSPCGNANRIWN